MTRHVRRACLTLTTLCVLIAGWTWLLVQPVAATPPNMQTHPVPPVLVTFDLCDHNPTGRACTVELAAEILAGVAMPDRSACDWRNPPPFDMPGVMADGTPRAVVATAIWQTGEAWWCDGRRWLRLAVCEGFNAASGWDPAHISPTDDVGLFQINWVHGKEGGLIAGGWPEAVDTVAENIEVAVRLRVRDGIQPWFMSDDCHTP